MNKNWLIIHPDDDSTSFLKECYKHIRNKTVINDPAFPNHELRAMLADYDKVMLLGHGNENGLFSTTSKKSIYRFNRIIVGSNLVYLLRQKKKLLGIFCHASEFFERYNLKGFSTGMFISELMEADYYSFPLNENWIEDSNNMLIKTIKENYNKPNEIIYEKFIANFENLTNNEIANYNASEIRYFT